MKKLEVLFDKTFLTILDIVQWSHNCKFHIASPDLAHLFAKTLIL